MGLCSPSEVAISRWIHLSTGGGTSASAGTALAMTTVVPVLPVFMNGPRRDICFSRPCKIDRGFAGDVRIMYVSRRSRMPTKTVVGMDPLGRSALVELAVLMTRRRPTIFPSDFYGSAMEKDHRLETMTIFAVGHNSELFAKRSNSPMP
jgi:hypothetical protein